MPQKGKRAQKIVGWVVKVGERKLIKTATISRLWPASASVSTPQRLAARRGKAMRGLDMPLRMGYGRTSGVARGEGLRPV